MHATRPSNGVVSDEAPVIYDYLNVQREVSVTVLELFTMFLGRFNWNMRAVNGPNTVRKLCKSNLQVLKNISIQIYMIFLSLISSTSASLASTEMCMKTFLIIILLALKP